MSTEPMPITMDYRFDNYLMYLIQDVTKKDSVDILAFFSDLAKAVATIGVEKRTGEGIRKDVCDFFPNTSIPFRMLVKGNRTRHRKWDPHQRSWTGEPRDEFKCTVEVGFPEHRMCFSEDKLKQITEALIERDLLGGEGIALQPFDRPSTKTPKLYKDMMRDICGVVPKKKKKEGYDPDITGNCRNCGGNPNRSWHQCKCNTEAK